jgi:hypothetical protein
MLAGRAVSSTSVLSECWRASEVFMLLAAHRAAQRLPAHWLQPSPSARTVIRAVSASQQSFWSPFLLPGLHRHQRLRGTPRTAAGPGGLRRRLR